MPDPDTSDDGLPRSQSAMRNRSAILDGLRHALPARGLVLEVASGTGEHVVHFAKWLTGLVFQPSDPDAQRRANVDARVRRAGLANVRPALSLDAAGEQWPIGAADAVLCSNMIHIAPWPAALGLICGAANILPAGGLFSLYGPFSRAGRHSVESNAAFDLDLQSRNPEWGVRDLDDVVSRATYAGFAAPEIVVMPANNLLVLFRRH